MVGLVKRPVLCLALWLVGCGGLLVERSVPYDDRFGDDTVMNVYMPVDGKVGRPAVLLIHGGGWRNGGRSHFREIGRRFGHSGYVAGNIEYRLAPENQYPAAVQDSLCALAFFRAESDRFGLDPDRVAVMGYSAGGHLASLMGVAAQLPAIAPDCAAGGTTDPQAVISGAGIHKFDTGLIKSLSSVKKFLGGTQEEIPEVWEEASPVTHVGSNEPPYLFVVGSFDPLLHQQKIMRDALEAAGNETELIIVPGSGHIANTGAGPSDRALGMSLESPEAWLAVMRFLENTVGAP